MNRKEIVERYVSVWNSNGIPDLEEVFTKKSIYWDATQEGGAMDILKNSIATTYEAFPDILFEIVSIKHTSENQFFLEWRMTGTNTGAFFEYPPTSKRVAIQGLDSIKFESDRIAEIKSFYDSGLISQQLGFQ